MALQWCAREKPQPRFSAAITLTREALRREPNIVGNPYNFSYGQNIQAAMGCPVGQQSLTCFFQSCRLSSFPPLAPGQKIAHDFGGDATIGDLRGPDQVNFDLGSR